VPENAYLSPSGSDWKCERGFARKDGKCIALSLPPKAYLDYSGGEWRCEDGFRKSDAQCLADTP
jgi:hypothetical protein